MANIKCPSCGSPNVEQIDVDQYQCPYCGKSFSMRPTPNVRPAYSDVPPQSSNQMTNYNEGVGVEDKPGCFIGGVCFLIPIVGLIIYFMKKKTQPNSAQTYLYWAIFGFILSFIINLISIYGGSSS